MTEINNQAVQQAFDSLVKEFGTDHINIHLHYVDDEKFDSIQAKKLVGHLEADSFFGKRYYASKEIGIDAFQSITFYRKTNVTKEEYENARRSE